MGAGPTSCAFALAIWRCRAMGAECLHDIRDIACYCLVARNELGWQVDVATNVGRYTIRAAPDMGLCNNIYLK